MHIVYVLFSEKLNKRYIGFTKDLSRRMAEHNAGKSVFTKSGLPWKIIYQESFVDKSDAM